jgi:hypothetical protein
MKGKLTYRNLVPAAEQALKILLFLAGDRSGKKSVARDLWFSKSVGGARPYGSAAATLFS